jgi:hypothetical protein
MIFALSLAEFKGRADALDRRAVPSKNPVRDRRNLALFCLEFVQDSPQRWRYRNAPRFLFLCLFSFKAYKTCSLVYVLPREPQEFIYPHGRLVKPDKNTLRGPSHMAEKLAVLFCSRDPVSFSVLLGRKLYLRCAFDNAVISARFKRNLRTASSRLIVTNEILFPWTAFPRLMIGS